MTKVFIGENPKFIINGKEIKGFALGATVAVNQPIKIRVDTKTFQDFFSNRTKELNVTSRHRRFKVGDNIRLIEVHNGKRTGLIGNGQVTGVSFVSIHGHSKRSIFVDQMSFWMPAAVYPKGKKENGSTNKRAKKK